eukprot:m.11895 g.11895  ORF g.11895 m.11895 type:complete len:327 (-) comp4551_c0_seq1:133-1113(-)
MDSTMLAATYTSYGTPNVITIKKVQKPRIKNNEVLIRVHAASVTTGDTRIRACKAPGGMSMIMRLMFGIFGPRNPTLGISFSGTIEEVGSKVTNLKVGDEVFGDAGMKMGAHAEYIKLKSDATIAHKPSNLTLTESASLCFGTATAWHFLKTLANVQPDQRVLIVGASGDVGAQAVQLAKHLGAHVTALCSGKNHDLVTSLGADAVIDYTKEDFTKNGQHYDAILDIVGVAPWSVSKNSLTDKGKLLIVVGSLYEMIQASFVSSKNGKQAIAGVSEPDAALALELKQMAEEKVFKPLVKTYPFQNIVEAHTEVDTGHKVGTVVVTM